MSDKVMLSFPHHNDPAHALKYRVYANAILGHKISHLSEYIRNTNRVIDNNIGLAGIHGRSSVIGPCFDRCTPPTLRGTQLTEFTSHWAMLSRGDRVQPS
ncbi:hypothetical protein CBL_05691 [Carabus blaptoides fortunei]